MKKYIYNLFMVLVAAAAMTSCTEDAGMEPGNDSDPSIIVYQYNASRPNNPDNDVILRFATNNKVTEAYYLSEKTADKEAYIKANGESSYMDRVVEKGTKIAGISGESNVDVTVTDLYGDCTITAVAVSNSKKASSQVVFSGLIWEDVATGTYIFATESQSGTPAATITGKESSPTVLQVCTTDATLYRFKDLFGTGYHMKINMLDIKNADADGEYQFFRVPATETPFTSKNGTISVRDVGYWQGNDSFVTEGGYESGMYANHNCFVLITYFSGSSTYGYGYDYFVAD